MKREATTRTRYFVIMALIAALLAMPAAALAAPVNQEGTADPTTIAAIQAGAAAVHGAFGGGSSTAVAPQTDVTPDEDPTPEPIQEGADVNVEVGEFVEYTSPEFSISFPENWVVADDVGGIFEAEDPESGFRLQVQNFGQDVPGLFMLPIFEGQADAFASSLGDDAEITGISRLTVGDDGLPAMRMTFANATDPSVGTMDGVLYVFAAGRDGYGLYGAVASEIWPTLEPVVDAVMESIVMNPEYITLQHAGDEPLEIVSEDGVYSLMLPPGWIGSVTADEDLGLIISDPDISIVGAVGLSPAAEVDDPMLQALVDGIGGDMDDEASAELIENILDSLDLGGDGNVVIDQSQTEVFASSSEDILGTIRVIGEAPLDDEMVMPMTMFISVYPNRAGAFVFVGDPESVLSFQSQILEVVDSMQILE